MAYNRRPLRLQSAPIHQVWPRGVSDTTRRGAPAIAINPDVMRSRAARLRSDAGDPMGRSGRSDGRGVASPWQNGLFVSSFGHHPSG